MRNSARIGATYRAKALAVLGRPEEAVSGLEPWLGLSPASDWLILPMVATWEADLGRLDAARQRLAALEALGISGSEQFASTAAVTRTRAAVAASEGDHELAVELLAEAAARWERFDVRFEAVDCLQRRARSLQALGRVAEALADLSSCLELLEKSGAGAKWTDPVVRQRVALQGVESMESGRSIAVVAASVATERPDLAPHAAADGTVTLVFTDLGDSTSLNEQLGDHAWMAVLRAHHDLVRSLVDRHGGTTVKSQGDGFMLAFPSARRAVECAVEIQRAASRQVAGDTRLRVRIGIHTGEVLRQGEDFFGRHVNLAARVAAAAAPGEILVSSLVHGLVSGDHNLRFGGQRSVELKGFEHPEPVYEVAWADD
jgi:class 3 adenylate cyclase